MVGVPCACVLREYTRRLGSSPHFCALTATRSLSSATCCSHWLNCSSRGDSATRRHQCARPTACYALAKTFSPCPRDRPQRRPDRGGRSWSTTRRSAKSTTAMIARAWQSLRPPERWASIRGRRLIQSTREGACQLSDAEGSLPRSVALQLRRWWRTHRAGRCIASAFYRWAWAHSRHCASWIRWMAKPSHWAAAFARTGGAMVWPHQRARQSRGRRHCGDHHTRCPGCKEGNKHSSDGHPCSVRSVGAGLADSLAKLGGKLRE